MGESENRKTGAWLGRIGESWVLLSSLPIGIKKLAIILQLRAARIPGPLGYLAAHYWFVVIRGSDMQRWEVWQNADAGGESWGHLHKNLKPFDEGVGHGPSWVEQQWNGLPAELIASVIESSPYNYENKRYYRYWPGPNSNTFVQWVLDEAKSDYSVGPLAIGKDYLGLAGYKKTGKVIRFSSPILGLKLKWPGEFEFQFLTMTIGIRFKPLSVRFPLELRRNGNANPQGPQTSEA